MLTISHDSVTHTVRHAPHVSHYDPRPDLIPTETGAYARANDKVEFRYIWSSLSSPRAQLSHIQSPPRFPACGVQYSLPSGLVQAESTVRTL